MPDSRVYATEIFSNLNSNGMKSLNVSPNWDLRLSKLSELKLCVSLITKMYRNSYLIGWLQNYGSKKALSCGMITLLNK